MAFLADAYVLNCDFERARTVALNCIDIATGLQTPLAAAVAQRVLGRLDLRVANLMEAERRLTEVLDIFERIDSVFESARRRIDLAELARLRGDPTAAVRHLRKARRKFESLNAPFFVECVDTLLRSNSA